MAPASLSQALLPGHCPAGFAPSSLCSQVELPLWFLRAEDQGHSIRWRSGSLAETRPITCLRPGSMPASASVRRAAAPWSRGGAEHASPTAFSSAHDRSSRKIDRRWSAFAVPPFELDALTGPVRSLSHGRAGEQLHTN